MAGLIIFGSSIVNPLRGAKITKVLLLISFQNSVSWKAGEIVIGEINMSLLHARYVFTATFYCHFNIQTKIVAKAIERSQSKWTIK